MKKFMIATTLALLTGSMAVSSVALAAPRPPAHHEVGHNSHRSSWHKGGRIAQTDWRHGKRIDYRSHHLSAPPRGYEWRDVDGDYVLAAVTTGVIASLILNSH